MTDPKAETDPKTATDPFGTAALRSAVLAGWAASELRFREDANAEEALARGGYADRALIELLANGTDSAVSAGESARIQVRFDGRELRVANTGAPLTAAGVAGLATLRASAKRADGGAVGHFGVGFTAVRAVTDAPRIVSRSGGVRFDLAATAAAVADLPSLRDELARRAGELPALRLPWPVAADEEPVPEGFTTEVRMPVRPEAVAALSAQLAELGPDLFFGLPGLIELRVEAAGVSRHWVRTDVDGEVRIGDRRYLVATVAGELDAALLADRPVEERGRTHWWLTWVRPSDGVPTGRLGAPTPTDEPLSLPADLYGTFPVDDTRRRLAAGPLTDHLLRLAARAYLDLLEITPAVDRWRLVPAGGFPLGPIDGSLAAQVSAALVSTPWLRTVWGDPIAVGDAVMLEGASAAAVALLAEAVPGVLPSPESSAQERALRRLGVPALPLADAVAALAGMSRPAEFWRSLYVALADAPTDALGGLPVPLAGGRMRIGPRGVLIAQGDLAAELVERLALLIPELPVMDPGATHPLLLRLGASAADAAAVLAAPALRVRFADFRADLDDQDPDPDELDELGTLALDLATASAGLVPMADVVLTDAQDEPWPAAELLAPDAPFAAVLAPDADLPLVHPRWSATYPTSVLGAVGVRTGLPVVTMATADLEDLPAGDEWREQYPEYAVADEVIVLADLDLIDPAKWATALNLLATDPRAREAVRDPRSYSSWWLRWHAELDGVALHHFRPPGSSELIGLYDPLPVVLDVALLAGLGLPGTLIEAAADDPAELLRRYADPNRTVPAARVSAVTRAVLEVLRTHPELPLPEHVRALDGRAIDPLDAVVLDQPWLAPLVGPDVAVPGGVDPVLVADTLELELASSALVVGVRPDPARTVDLTAVFAALGEAEVPISVVAELAVDVDGRSVRVSWWPGPTGLRCDGSATGIGRAVAWGTGRWADRHLAEAVVSGTLTDFGLD